MGHVTGMHKFRKYLEGTPGLTVYNLPTMLKNIKCVCCAALVPLQVLNFWLDIERFNNVDDSHVSEKWQRFREIQLKYFELGTHDFPETADTAEDIIESETRISALKV